MGSANLGEHNLWGKPTYLRDRGYQQLDNNGSMDHTAIVEICADDDTATFEHDLVWHSQSGAELDAERRRITASTVGDHAWVLGFSTTMRNVSGSALPIGSPTTEGRENAGYAGLFWRGPRSFTDGVVLSPHGPGGDELRGTRHPWLGFSGTHDEDEAVSSILIVDAEDNPRHPPRWFARSSIYGYLNPAPFFDEEYVLDDGESVTFRYSVVIADGAANEERCDELAAAGREVLA